MLSATQEALEKTDIEFIPENGGGAGVRLRRTGMTDIENRHAVRQRTMNRARIVFDNGCISVGCVVKDLSASGARLTTDGYFNYPDKIDLLFLDGPERLRLPKSCRVVWRNDDAIGVHFQAA